MFLLGALLFFVVVTAIAFILATDPVQMVIFVSMSNVFVYVFIIVAITLATSNIRMFFVAVNALVSKKYYISAANKERAVRYFELISRTVWYTAAIFTVMPLLFMLLSLDDPTSLGPKLSVTLVSLFYGLVINAAFVYPAIHILENRYNMEEKRVISEKQVVDKLLELCYRQGISPEEVIDAGEISFKKGN